MALDRIGPSGPSRLTGSQPGAARAQARAARNAGDLPRDRIDLSAAARRLADASPEERAEVVQRLRDQVEAGAYTVDPDAVAQKMVTQGDV